jgi:hypothetical protein
MGFFDLGLGPIADVMKDLIQLFPTAEQRAAAASKIQDAQAAISAQQAAIDTAEAANTSLFVSGWRPFIGWVCGFGFVYSIVGPVFHLPAVDTSNIVSILAGMLGLGTMRTVEKLNNLPPTIRKK